MGNKIELTLEERTVRGKKVAQLRKQSIVPAVVYGADFEPRNVQVDRNTIAKVYAQAGTHSPVYLSLGGKKRIAMIKDVEFDVVKHVINHVSFHAVNAKEAVTAEVPIHLMGEGNSPAEQAGLVVLQAVEKIEVKAKPTDLPEALEVATDSLKEAGDKLTVGDIVVPKNVEIVDNDDGREGTADDDVTVMDLTIATVYEPGALQAANEAAGGDAEDAAPADEEEEGSAEETAA